MKNKKNRIPFKKINIPVFTYESQVLYNKLTINHKEGRWGRLGVGVGRRVFSVLENRDVVIKIEKSVRDRHDNLIEWFIYHNYPDLRGWLAKPIAKSNCHKYMLMERGVVLSSKIDIPRNIPEKFFLGDENKAKNWIRLTDNRIVMCDYSHSNFVINYVEGKIDYKKQPYEPDEWKDYAC